MSISTRKCTKKKRAEKVRGKCTPTVTRDTSLYETRPAVCQRGRALDARRHSTPTHVFFERVGASHAVAINLAVLHAYVVRVGQWAYPCLHRLSFGGTSSAAPKSFHPHRAAQNRQEKYIVLLVACSAIIQLEQTLLRPSCTRHRTKRRAHDSAVFLHKVA